jgi:hypothetical protein
MRLLPSRYPYLEHTIHHPRFQSSRVGITWQRQRARETPIRAGTRVSLPVSPVPPRRRCGLQTDAAAQVTKDRLRDENQDFLTA